MARGRKKTETQDTGAQLGIEAELFKAADKLRGNMEPSDYKHVALGLIFLKVYFRCVRVEAHRSSGLGIS